ncbi:MAG: ABC transporter permease, partial [Aristaeellaceae bacterium]
MQQHPHKSFLTRLGILVLAYLLLAAGMYWIVERDWSITAVKAGGVSPGYLLPANSEVTQQFQVDMDGLDELTIIPHFDQAERTGAVTLRIMEQDAVVWSLEMPVEEWTSDEAVAIAVEPSVQSTQGLTLSILPNDTGLSLWAGSTVNTGRYEVPVAASGLQVNGEAAEGSLVLRLQGHNLLSGARWFWPVALALLAGLVALCCVTHVQLRQGRRTALTRLVQVCRQYRYLLRQLVNRDFRVKYKSSSLGMIWSFLNPLLTMLVYLVVFSTLFNSDIEHFPVYLMAGIVCFSFFSEATNLGMSSIVGNSALITKVYMP